MSPKLTWSLTGDSPESISKPRYWPWPSVLHAPPTEVSVLRQRNVGVRLCPPLPSARIGGTVLQASLGGVRGGCGCQEGHTRYLPPQHGKAVRRLLDPVSHVSVGTAGGRGKKERCRQCGTWTSPRTPRTCVRPTPQFSSRPRRPRAHSRRSVFLRVLHLQIQSWLQMSRNALRLYGTRSDFLLVIVP